MNDLERMVNILRVLVRLSSEVKILETYTEKLTDEEVAEVELLISRIREINKSHRSK